MTAKRRLVSDSELRRALDIAQEYGVEIGGFDVRADGVTVFPKNQAGPGNAFDAWQTKDKNSDRPAHG